MSDVAALGDPTTVVDGQRPPAALLRLSQQLDATAAGLAQWGGALAPFGTAGVSGS
jgi:hypothetical protein